MKKFTKALILMLAALMLLASCAPEPEKTPEPEPKPDKNPPAITVPLPKDKAAEDGSWTMNYKLDPEHPYDATHYGIFHDQKVTTAAGEIGTYSIYIPKGFQPKSQAMIILIPNGTTAEDWWKTETGKAWKAAADEKSAFAVVMAEPVEKAWNTACDKGTKDAPKRDDAKFINSVFAEIRKKSWVDGGNAFVSVDKNGASLLGYKEGADMAAIVAASFPATFANTTLIEPTAFDAALIDKILAAPGVPHSGDSHNIGRLKNGQIPMPMRVHAGTETDVADAIVAKWNEINAEAVTFIEDTTSEHDNPAVLTSELIENDAPAALAATARSNGRFLGYAGGTLRTRPDTFGDERFNRVNEYKIEGDKKVRRYMTYTPTGAKADRPLVVILHGSSSAITDICEESRWTDVADKHGLELLFIQGYPNSSAPRSAEGSWGAAIPGWNLFDKSMNNDDIKYILHVTDKVIKDMDLNPERVYLTGHSLGAMMTCTLMNVPEAAAHFAAFAPIGAFWGPDDTLAESDLEIPVWGLLGEWEFAGWGDPGNSVALAWANRFGIEKMPNPDFFFPGYPARKYSTWSFKDAEKHVPVKATQVIDSPHVYMAEEARMVYEMFFSGIQRDAETKKIEYI